MQKNYLILKKVSGQLKKDSQKVLAPSFTEENWKEEGKKIYSNLNSFGKLMKECENKMNYLKKVGTNNEDINTILEKNESEYKNAKDNIEPLAEEMHKKISKFSGDIQFESNQEVKIGEGKIEELSDDLMNDEDVLKNRTEQLKIMHRTSGNIKDMTDKMRDDVVKQGNILRNTEEKTANSEENAQQAHQKVEEASKMNEKKCLIF